MQQIIHLTGEGWTSIAGPGVGSGRIRGACQTAGIYYECVLC